MNGLAQLVHLLALVAQQLGRVGGAAAADLLHLGHDLAEGGEALAADHQEQQRAQQQHRQHLDRQRHQQVADTAVADRLQQVGGQAGTALVDLTHGVQHAAEHHKLRHPKVFEPGRDQHSGERADRQHAAEDSKLGRTLAKLLGCHKSIKDLKVKSEGGCKENQRHHNI